MKRRTLTALGASALATFAAACGGPTLEVRGFSEAPVSLGATRVIAFTDANGARAAVGAAIDAAALQVERDAWFEAIDATDQGELVVTARGPFLTNGDDDGQLRSEEHTSELQS